MTKQDKNRSGKPQQLVGSWQRKGGGALVEIPITWERALLKAAREPVFAQQLIEDRALAIERAGFRLSDSESAMLAALPDRALAGMIDSIDPGRLKNQRFVKTVAAAAMVGGIMVANIHCEAPHTVGATDADVDMDNDTDSDTDTDTDADTDTDTDTDTDVDAGPDAGPDASSDGGE